MEKKEIYYTNKGKKYLTEEEDKKVKVDVTVQDTSTEFITDIFKLFWWITKTSIVYSPFLIVGWFISEKFLGKGDYHYDAEIIGVSILIAYIAYSLVFFIKGLLIGLRDKGYTIIWIFLWLVCVTITCITPTTFVWFGLAKVCSLMKDNSVLPWHYIFPVVGTILFSIYVYSKYQFEKPGATKLTYWTYTLGIRLVS